MKSTPFIRPLLFPARKPRILLLILSLLPVADLRAASFTWTGGFSAEWSFFGGVGISNWGGLIPSGGDDFLLFPSGGANKAMNNDFSAGTNFMNLNFQETGYSLAGNSFDLIPGATAPEIRLSYSSGTTVFNVPFRLRDDPSVARLRVDNAGATLDLNQPISEETASTPDLSIIGDGNVRFDAAMTYDGLTTVGDGTDSPDLIVTGSIAGAVLVKGGATLHATGTIGTSTSTDLTVEGILNPGDPQGDTTQDFLVNGDLVFSSAVSTDQLVLDLDGTGGGTTYDQIDVSSAGTVTTNGATLIIQPGIGFELGTVFTLISNAGTNAIVASSPFRIGGASVTEGSEFNIGFNRFRFSYVGGTGNDFTATVVPALSSGSRTWDAGGSTRNFSEAANWSSNNLPDAGNTLNFNSTAPAAPLAERFPINDLGGNYFALNFTEGGYNIDDSNPLANRLILSGGITASHASTSSDGSVTIDAGLSLAAPQTFSLTGSGFLRFDGAISNNGHLLTLSNSNSNELRINGGITGGGGLTKTGTGRVLIGGSGSNTYAATTAVNQGELRLSRSTSNGAVPRDLVIGDGAGGSGSASATTTAAEQIADLFTVTIRSDGAFLPGAAETIGGLVFDGGTLDSSTHTLAVGGNVTANQNADISSPIQINGSVRDWTVAAARTLTLSGTLAISPLSSGTTQRKLGSGTLVVAGTTAVTTFDLAAGTLQLDNNSSNQTLGILLNGGNLTGGGRAVRITANTGGTVSPGTGTGTAVFEASKLTLDSSTTVEFDINGSSVGSGYDRLDIAASGIDSTGGQVSLGSAALVLRNPVVIPVGTVLTLISNDGSDAVTGTFAGRPQGSIILTQFNRFSLNYTGGTGNDVTLTALAPVPTGITRVWDGGAVGDNWTLAANWVGDTAPQPGDSLNFPSGLHTSSTNDYPAGTIFDAITLDGVPASSATRSISGNAVTLLGNLVADVPAPVTEIEIGLPVTFPNSSQLQNLGTARVSVVSTLAANGGTFSFASDSPTTRPEIRFSAAGVLTGNANVSVLGNAFLNLGNLAHSHTGTTVVDHGRLDAASTNVLHSSLTVGTGASAAEVNLSGSASVRPGSISVADLGRLTFTGGTVACQSFSMTEGIVVAGSNLLQVGTFSVSGGTYTGSEFSSLIFAPLSVTGAITQSGGNVKTGTISAAALTLTDGVLVAATTTVAGAISIDGGSFATSSFGDVIATSMSVNSGSADIDRDITLSGALNVTTSFECGGDLLCGFLTMADGQVTVGGLMASAADVLVDGSDSLAVNCLIAGDLTVSGGTLTIGEYIELSGDLQLVASSLNVPNILKMTGAGNPTLFVEAGQVLQVARLGGASAINPASVQTDGDGEIIVSNGTESLAEVIVRGGTFRFDAPDGGGVAVTAAGGKIAGSGVLGAISVERFFGSRVSPGASPGLLSVASIASSASGIVSESGGLDFEIAGSPLPGIFHDQLAVEGSANFDPAHLIQLNVTFPGGYVPLEGVVYTLIDKSSLGAITGNLFILAAEVTEGFEQTLPGGTVLRYSYIGGDGNDFTATVIDSSVGEFRRWDGGGADDDWSTAENWESDFRPQPTDRLLFPAGAARTTNVNDYATNTRFDKIRIESGYNLSGNPIDTAEVESTSAAASALAAILKPSGDLLVSCTGTGGLTLTQQITLTSGAEVVLRRLGTTGGDLVIGGKISGGPAGSTVLCDGDGTVRYEFGNSHSALTETRVLSGTLSLQSFDGLSFAHVPGDLIIGGGPSPALVRSVGDRILGRLILEQNGTHQLVGGSPDEDVNELILRGGSAIHPVGGVFGVESVIRAQGGGTRTLDFPVAILNNSPTIEDRIEVADGTVLDLTSSLITPAFNLTRLRKTGPGVLKLSVDLMSGFTTANQFSQEEGSTLVTEGTTLRATTLRVEGGTLTGNGDLVGVLSNSPATFTGAIAPSAATGSGIGRLDFLGDFLPDEGNTFRFEIGGTVGGTSHDLIVVDGFGASSFDVSASKLEVELVNGFIPTPGQKFTLIRNIIDGTNASGPFSDGLGGSLDEGEQVALDGYLFTISYIGNHTSNLDDDIELTAVGPAAEIGIEQPEFTTINDGGSVNFGFVPLLGTKDLEFTVRNTGPETLFIEPPTFTGPEASRFQMISPFIGQVAGNGGTASFVVRFTPVGAGASSAELVLVNSDLDENPYHISLSGTSGAAAPSGPSFVSAPTITPATSFTGASLSGNVIGAPFGVVKLEASTDLGIGDPWQVIGQVSLDSGGLGTFSNVSDPGSVGSSRSFFRLRTD